MSSPEPAEDTLELEIKSILVLDDDIELADILKDLLSSRNYVVTTVRNGAEGLREVMAMDFDVILCDILMPAMAGDMFYLAVQRTKPELCDRFIFVTAYADDPKVDEFLKKTGALVLLKPVNADELVHAISIVLKRGRESEKIEVE